MCAVTSGHHLRRKSQAVRKQLSKSPEEVKFPWKVQREWYLELPKLGVKPEAAGMALCSLSHPNGIQLP
jgi:hypothetical protein